MGDGLSLLVLLSIGTFWLLLAWVNISRISVWALGNVPFTDPSRVSV